MRLSYRNFFIFTTGFFLSVFFLFSTETQAATSTIKGKAYWGDLGYIYFDCSEDLIGNRLDEVGNFSGGSTYKEPPAELGFHFYSPSCTENPHGVSLNDNNEFSGSAWNPSYGEILFGYIGIDPPNWEFANHCPNCANHRDCIACYDEETQTIHGWAKVMNSASHHWVKLDSDAPIPTQMRSGELNPELTGYNIEPGDFVGTAKPHNPDSDYGSISFNCEGETYPTSTCAIRDYKVYIKNLRFGRLSAPNWSYSSACQSSALQATLRWEKLSGVQTGYEVLVREDDNLSTSTGFTCWTGKRDGEVSQFIITPSNPFCQGNGGFKYNTTYYWWVRGYDQDGLPTEWYQYGTNTSTDTDLNLDGRADTFQTFKHEFPNPFFTWDPLVIVANSTGTVFTSESLAYVTGNPAPQSCEPGRCTYNWSTTDPSATISASTSATTTISFFDAGNVTVTLRVRDTEGYECSMTSPTFTINYDLPLWREVKAK